LINQNQPIAKITNIAGFNGKVFLRPLSRYFDDYISCGKLSLGSSPDDAKRITLEFIKGQGKKRRFKFDGINTELKAKNLVGKYLFVKASPNEDINLVSNQLIGYEVINEKEEYIGKLTDVMWLPKNDAYIVNDGKKEYLIPIIPEIIKSFNHEEKRIIITTMDGLLD